jgi:hypothetical protein
MKIEIKNDVFNICKRIRRFDKNYKIIYDSNLKKYQIYSTSALPAKQLVGETLLSYICTLPYEELDVRTIKYLNDTRSENIYDMLKRIDENNEQIEKANQNKILEQSSLFAESRLRQLTK